MSETTMERDLFEAQVQNEVRKRVQVEVSELLRDPARRAELLLEIAQRQQTELAELKPKARKYDQVLDADGYLSVAQAAPLVGLEYIAPDGRIRVMGQNHFIKVLLYDHVLVRTVGGFYIHSKYRDQLRGKAVVRVSERANGIKESVLFTPAGLDWLIDKYSRDTRKWHSTPDHEVFYE